MRYFLPEGEDAARIREGPVETKPRGGRIYTDPKSGERWEDFLSGIAPRGPFWAGLVRHPFPDSSFLLAVCRNSDDFNEVAAASLALNNSVETRWQLLDLVEFLIEQSAGTRVQVLLDNGVFEFPSGLGPLIDRIMELAPGVRPTTDPFDALGLALVARVRAVLIGLQDAAEAAQQRR